jgi:hypothetical protein
MASSATDLILIYQFLKRLTTPFDKTDAYELGLIDANGKLLKKPSTKEEKEAYGYFDRLVFNLKRLLAKVPGGSSRLGSFAAALWLVKESKDGERDITQEELAEELQQVIVMLEESKSKTLRDLYEEAPANATGSAVAGTGDDPVHWKKIDARKKEVKNFLRRYTVGKAKREALKKRRDFMKQLGL